MNIIYFFMCNQSNISFCICANYRAKVQKKSEIRKFLGGKMMTPHEIAGNGRRKLGGVAPRSGPAAIQSPSG